VKTYILQRLLLMVPTIFGVSLVVWAITAAAPEPPIQSQMPSIEGGKRAGEAGVLTQATKAYRAQFGLDKPAMLNFYYDLDPAEVEAALEQARGLGAEDEDRIKRQSRAIEQLIKWGYYAVPAMVELLQKSDGSFRDYVLAWFGKSAERVTRSDPTAKLDEETATENAIIATENRLLALCAWESSDSPDKRAACVAGIKRWYEGAKSEFGEGESLEIVRTALTGGEPLGERAVPALVQIVLEGEEHCDLAVRALAKAAEREGDSLWNESVAMLAWPADASTARRKAGVELVRDWWEGTYRRWDSSGIRWLRTLFFETQFATYWGNLLRLDLGFSSVHKEPVSALVLRRLKYSLTLTLSSILLAYLISVPLGLLSARIHGSATEKAITLVLFILYSLPSFFVATLLIRFLAEGQPGSPGIIPTGGFESPNAWELVTMDRLKDILWHVVAPIFCMTYASFAALSRYAKSGLLNVIRSDYVRTARAKGLTDFVVTYKHAARPGIIPVITLLGGILPVVVSGSFIIEWIFGIPGFGLLLVESVKNNDYNVIVGNTLIVAALVMFGILLSDLLYAVADPRISYS
jgi:peptide/nickel transport system permease protein